MKTSERIWRIGSDFAGVLPRAHAAVSASDDWSPLSVKGARQLGEVVLDELALSGMTLTAPPPRLERSVQSCADAGAELASLGVSGANADPHPLQVKSIRRQRLGRQTYERLTFDHDPTLPDVLSREGFGGPATAVVHLCRQGDDQRPWLVWVHGAGQGQPIDLLFSRARRIQEDLGFNIALPVQPGCGVRSRDWPAYPNMDPLANVAGMMRAV
ncbi:alpha/beta hydrolase, partial [Mycobacterium sp. ITM-2017-0098]